jgi:trk system potassium uptake protein TrkH
MHLVRHISPLDLRVVRTHLAVLLQLLGAALTLPLIVALLAGEFFMGAVFGGLTVGAIGLGRAGARGRPANIELKEALVVTALAYLMFGFVGALALLPVAPLLDGFFEAMSGFTTTGLSVLDLEGLPQSVLFFRAYAQWIGGAGIIVLSLAVLLGPGKAAFRLYTSEYGEENLIGSVIATARVVLGVYTALTAVGFLAYVAAGMGPWDALLHALATLSTGGFSPYSESIARFAGPWVPLAVTAFMLAGAISFPLYFIARREGLRRIWDDLQLRALLGIWLLATLLFWGAGGWRSDGLLPGLFQAASALTTTGFAVSDASSWPEPLVLITMLLMIVGGSAGSTAGGIKLLRLILLWKVAQVVVVRTLLPEEAKVPLKHNDVAISERDIELLLGFFGLYLAIWLLGAAALALGGFPALDSLFESASALGTVGLSTGVTSPELAGWAKLLLIVEMWAGRLEILPVLVVLYPGTWRWRRRS